MTNADAARCICGGRGTYFVATELTVLWSNLPVMPIGMSWLAGRKIVCCVFHGSPELSAADRRMLADIGIA